MNKSKAFIVGIVVTIGFIILIFVSFYMNKVKIALSNNYVYVKIKNADGLLKNDEVRLRGVKCGYVREIKLIDDYVLLKLWFENDIKITKNSQIGLHDLALIGGTKYLMLYPAPGEAYKFPNDTLNAINYSLNMSKFLVLFEDFKTRLEALLPDSTSIQDIVDTIQLALSNINTLIENTDKDIHNIMVNVDTISMNVNEMVDTLTTVVYELKEEIDVYKKQDNSLKSFVSSDSLYINLQNSLDELNRLLKQLNRNKVIKGCL